MHIDEFRELQPTRNTVPNKSNPKQAFIAHKKTPVLLLTDTKIIKY
jgi:hypothetical protein